jgi:glycosyltransferase involved in cell wall biosynthesis
MDLPAPYQINQVLSTGLLRSAIFDDLIARLVAAAVPNAVVTKSIRPRRGADVFHYHRPNLERRLRARSVVTVHHDLREVEPWLDFRSFLPRYREAKVVHCLNTMQQAFLAEHGIHEVRVIPHGVDRRRLPLPDAPRRLAHPRLRLGLFSRRYARGVKGEAMFETLLDHLDPARISFMLFGEERWRDAAQARAKGFTVACFERPPYRLIDALVGSIDALLILSRYEGGPASLPEALGSGVPVLATPVGMVPDFVRDGHNGLILTGDANRDGMRIMALLEESAADASYSHLAAGAFIGAAGIPDWEDVMRRWFDMYSAT